MAGSEIVATSNLESFFHERLTETVSNHKLEVYDETVVYLTHLLTQFTYSDRFFDSQESGNGLRPLASLYTCAVSTDDDKVKREALQRLGDVALFVAGWFSQSLERRNISADYYIQMGGLAYEWLGDTLEPQATGRVFADIFHDLSQHFPGLVDVLNDIHLSMETSSDKDLLRLYELWLDSGSVHAARLLKAKGIDVIQSSKNTTRH